MSKGRSFRGIPPLGKAMENPGLTLRSTGLNNSMEKMMSNNVLRYGETIESLFHLDEKSATAYRNACEEIIYQGPSPRIWRRLLELTPLTGSNLLRLYRRATNRFPIRENDPNGDLLHIWLSYARLVLNPNEILEYVGHFEWTRKDARYYLCLADLDPCNAQQHLCDGRNVNAEPVEQIHKALARLGTSSFSERSLGIKEKTLATSSSNPSESINQTLPFETGEMRCTGDKNKRHPLMPLAGKDDRSPAMTSSQRATSSTREETIGDSRVNSVEQFAEQKNTIKPNAGSATKQGNLAGSQNKRQAKPPLPSRRLKPSGRLGKAVRVDKMSAKRGSEEEEDTGSKYTSRPLKLTKKDLAYMFDWNPEDRLNSSTRKSQEDENTKNSEVDENPTDTASSHESHDQGNMKPKKQTSSMTPNDRFSNLISEQNMIYVNETPYMKLGVIGKGGSSKVYRVMSDDGRIWALKKVSLAKANLGQHAMNGYINEIELLRRLSDHTCIIHLRDSEVIMHKVIYMVMEAGEADLNVVLRQMQNANSLNLNFVRLTWLQMLNAVDSIHEARIIHGTTGNRKLIYTKNLTLCLLSGDLKPANFLFVSGTLKLIDFGIAKAIQSDDTTNIYRESQTGTWNYMSPESLQHNDSKLKCGRVRTSFRYR